MKNMLSKHISVHLALMALVLVATSVLPSLLLRFF